MAPPECPQRVDSSGLILLTGTAGIGALQPIAARVALGSDPAGWSRAAIARSCPKPDQVALPRRLCPNIAP